MYKLTKEYIQQQIDALFHEMALRNRIEDGDVTPEQAQKIDKIVEQLESLLEEYVEQNKK